MDELTIDISEVLLEEKIGEDWSAWNEFLSEKLDERYPAGASKKEAEDLEEAFAYYCETEGGVERSRLFELSEQDLEEWFEDFALEAA